MVVRVHDLTIVRQEPLDYDTTFFLHLIVTCVLFFAYFTETLRRGGLCFVSRAIR